MLWRSFFIESMLKLLLCEDRTCIKRSYEKWLFNIICYLGSLLVGAISSEAVNFFDFNKMHYFYVL